MRQADQDLIDQRLIVLLDRDHQMMTGIADRYGRVDIRDHRQDQCAQAVRIREHARRPGERPDTACSSSREGAWYGVSAARGPRRALWEPDGHPGRSCPIWLTSAT